LADFVATIHAKTGCLVLADIATLEEGLAAEAAGADLVSTTMSGYTADRPAQPGPDLALVRQLALRLQAVVVGGAITRPQEITAWFVSALQTGNME
jgi:putative N-acetylmannosamine-6-phosphate epimerase